MNDDSPNLYEILAEAERPAPEAVPQTVAQDAVRTFLDAHSTAGAPGLTQAITADPLDVIRRCIGEDTGRALGHFPTWVRFFRPDLSRSFLVVLHAPSPLGEVDLLVLGHRGVLNRTVLRAAIRWGFHVGGWTRIVARVPPERADLGDLLRRCGFRLEGTARGAFNGLGDASVWGLTFADAARFLPRSQRPVYAIPVRDTSPPPSLKVH